MSRLIKSNQQFQQQRSGQTREGFTLVEILVALVVSLILMGAVVSLFGFLGEAINSAKATVEVDERIAHMRDMLQNDLKHITARGVAVPGKPQPGAFEIGEGQQREHMRLAANRVAWEASQNSDANDVELDERVGDVDDWLYLTLRNLEQPYIGRTGTAIISGEPGNPGNSDAGESSSGDGSDDGGATDSSEGNETGPLDPVFVDNGLNPFNYQVQGAWIKYTQAENQNDGDCSYKNDYDVCAPTANDNDARAIWKFSVASPGTYKISATWAAPPNVDAGDILGPDNHTRSTNVQYVIRKPLGGEIIRQVDQTKNPTANDVADERNFQTLFSGSLGAGELVITLRSRSDGAVVADAMRVQCTDCTGDGPVSPGGGSDGNTTGGTTGTDGSGGGAPSYVAGITAESPLAEVIWFVTRDPNNPGRMRLHRYQLLIAADADLGPGGPNGYFYFNDISARLEDGVMVPNSLEDLAVRAHRRAHLAAGGVSSILDPNWHLNIDSDIDWNAWPPNARGLSPEAVSLVHSLGNRLNETVVMDNVVAFDVKVFDPTAPVLGILKPGTTSGGNEEGPGDDSPGGGDGGDPAVDPVVGLTVVDNDDGGFGSSGNWQTGSGGHGSGHLWKVTQEPGGATWTFGGLSPGEYDVYATWRPWDDAATDAKFLVSVGGTVAARSTVSQRSPPSGDGTSGSTSFQQIGTVEIEVDGSSLIVKLDDAPVNGRRIIADAVAIKSTGSGGGGSSDGDVVTDGASTGGSGLDPTANAAAIPMSMHLSPNDPGYLDTLPQAIANHDLSDPDGPQIVGYGAFVDMFQYIPQSVGYNPVQIGAPWLQFNSGGNPKSGIVPTPLTEQDVEFPMPAIYDTWSPSYNVRAYNQFDDDGKNGVDDPGEVSTPPPFEPPLRAVQITVRIYEPTSKKIRTVTVEHSFVKR